jgi:hypothetical protein
MKTLKKNAAYLMAIVALAFAMNACEDDEEKVNQLPGPPALQQPANNAENIGETVNLTWRAGIDAEGDPASADVHVRAN